MINIQLRGKKVKINISSINEETLKIILDDISCTKKSLAELVFESNFKKISNQIHNLGTYENAILSNDTELIVTAFDKDDYYSDGYSFFREKVKNIIDNPVYENFQINKKRYLFINYEVYYGCIFETELNQLNYRYFNPDYFSISSKKIPFIDSTLINELFFNNLPLSDLNRSKIQMVEIKSALFEKNNIPNQGIVNQENWLNLDCIIKSEKAF